jgi:DNA-binding FrmR family transcriptional regulator
MEGIMAVKVRKTSGSARRKNRHEPAANCACDTGAGWRKAIGVDPGLKAANQNRLRRIEGQIRGLQKMVEEDRYCADIITQVASVQEALRGVARNLMKNHLHHCAAKALKSGKKEETEAMYDELLELIYAHLR